MFEESRPVENFEFNGGHLCLDFINTLSDRFLPTPNEVLATYTDLLIWSQRANILASEQVQQFQSRAEQQPELATRCLTDIKQARARLFQLFSTIAAGEAASGEEIEQFNQTLSKSMAHLCLLPHENGFTWGWAGSEDHLELPLWPIARDAAELLASPELHHIRVCASTNCDWLFLDTSKNHRRRWCDMKVCGNRAKARRYYGRQRLIKQV